MPGKTRSPNYPALSLPQVVDVARKLWTAEKRTPVTHDAAALAMGFKSLSGPARVAIGALRQYGLIEKADKGHIRLSDLAIRILLADQATDRQAALQEAATTPELFQELAKNHSDGSENAIRTFLLTKKGFADDGARKAARAFRETLALAKTGDTGYTRPENGQEREDMQGNDAGQNVRDAGTGGGRPADGVFSLNVPFAKGSISVQVRVVGDAIKPAHLARVRKYLELAEQDWEGGDE